MTTTPLRKLARQAWHVRDLGKQLLYRAGPFAGYFDRDEDAFVPSATHAGVPRTGAIAVIGQMASDRVGLLWKVEGLKAIGRREGRILVEVRKVDTEYQVTVTQQPAPVTLHLAALHGIAVLRESERPVSRRRQK